MGITELTIAVWPWLLTMLVFLGIVTYVPGTVALAPTHARDDVAGLLIALSNRVDPESAKFF